MPILVLAGDEDFLLGRRVAELKKELVDPAWEAFNYVRMVNPDLQEVTDSLASLPFGAGNKMILIDRCELFTKKKTKSASDDEVTGKAAKQQLDDFDKALGTVAQNTYVVFACPYKFDNSLKTSKIMKTHIEPELFERPRYFAGSKNATLDTWCRKEAKRFDAIIDDDAIHYLLDSSEADLRMVASEIEKAATYLLPNKHITLETVHKISSYHSHAFTMLDDWVAGRTADALKSLTELLSRQNGNQIIAIIQTTLSRWLEIRARADNLIAKLPQRGSAQRREIPTGKLSSDIAHEMHLHNDWIVRQDLERTKARSLGWLIERRKHLCQLENLVKTGQMADTHALVSFISG